MNHILVTTIILVAAIVLPARCHWTYNRLIVNGEIVGEPWQYIRYVPNAGDPLQDVNSTDMRCNVNGSSGADTQTYAVRAGDELGFGLNETFGHPGIQQVYLSRVPPSVAMAADYDGAGGWARIYSLTTSAADFPGGSNDSEADAWATHNIETFRFALPASTPSGEYLLRAEGLALHAAHKVACAQFYVSCAQIKVLAGSSGGGGEGLPGPLVKFPGAYTGFEPGVLIPEFWSQLTEYTTPGPALWPEGTVEEHVAKVL